MVKVDGTLRGRMSYKAREFFKRAGRKGRKLLFIEHHFFMGAPLSHLIYASHLVLTAVLWGRSSSIWIRCPGPTARIRQPGFETSSV